MHIKVLTRFARDEDGAVAVIVSLLLVVLLGFTALGVDVASLYRERAKLQSVSDLVAISAMAVPDTAAARATYALSRNNRTADALDTLQTGRFLRNPDIAPEDRFVVLPAGSSGVNAVRVVLEADAPLHFARIFSDESSVTLDRTSLASRTGTASFSLESHIINLNSTNLNGFLTQEFGASAAVNLGTLQVLADTSVNLGALLGALNDVTGNASRNPAEILNATTTAGDLVTALQTLLPASPSSALDGLRNASANTAVDVASLVGGLDTDLGLTATDALAAVDITALDVLRALVIAQGADATVALDTDIDVAGIVTAQTSITAGEPAAQSGLIALGEEGAQLHRAAIRLQSDIAVEPSLLGNLGVGVQVAEINLPIYTEIAGSTATLDELGCNITSPASIAASFTTAATPLHPANGTSVAALYLGTLPDTSGPINPTDVGFADILSVNIVIDVPLLPDITIPGLTIQARSTVAVGASMSETVAFTIQDVADGNSTKTFGSGTLLSSALNTLLSPTNTEFRVKPGQDGLVSSLAAPIVATLLDTLSDRLLSALAAPLDDVLDATLDTAGIELGAGELELLSHHCEPIQLVR